jgi:murein DD-endopeptidase MepM/ murein hydrolase activator NlpD
MKKQHTTVLIVSNDDTKTRSFNIKSRHFKNLKIYIYSACTVILAFIIFCVSMIINLKISFDERCSLGQKVKSMENEVKLIDSLNIKSKINNIENRIIDIDKYLKERGVRKDISGIGGDADTIKTADVSLYDFYENHTGNIFVNIHNIPLGYPMYGELKSDYGYRANPFSGRSSEFHKGIDIKGNIGDTVKCTGDGFVVSADWDKGYGKCVTIKHEYGIECIYGHLSDFNVVRGQYVKAGDVIGFVGSTGRSTGPHLHYEIRRFSIDINPHNFLILN